MPEIASYFVLTGIIALPKDISVAVFVPMFKIVAELVSIALSIIFKPDMRVGFVNPPKFIIPVVILVPIFNDAPIVIDSIVFVFTVLLKVFDVHVQILDSVKKLAIIPAT